MMIQAQPRTKAQSWPRSSTITGEVEIVGLAIARIAKLDRQIKELSDIKKEKRKRRTFGQSGLIYN